MSAASPVAAVKLPNDMLLHIADFLAAKDQANWVHLNSFFKQQIFPDLHLKLSFRLITFAPFQLMHRSNETLEEYIATETKRFTKAIDLINKFTPELLNRLHTHYLGMGHFLSDTLLGQAVIQGRASTQHIWPLYSRLIRTLLNQGAKLESIRSSDLRETLRAWLKPQPKPVQPAQKLTAASAVNDKPASH